MVGGWEFVMVVRRLGVKEGVLRLRGKWKFIYEEG